MSFSQLLFYGERFYDVESLVALPRGLMSLWSSSCDAECVGWRTPMWKDVVDVDTGTPSSGDRPGRLQVKDITVAGLECITSP